MSKPDICCPICGAELSIELLFAHAQDHRAFTHLAMLSIPVGARVLAYIGLFAPAKNRLTLARKVKLLEQLLPDLQRQAITHNGRDWEVPLKAWALAIDGVLSHRDGGKLRLPLTSHGYLYAVLAGMADKVERSDEAAVEVGRSRKATGPTQGFMSAADVLLANPHLQKGTGT